MRFRNGRWKLLLPFLELLKMFYIQFTASVLKQSIRACSGGRPSEQVKASLTRELPSGFGMSKQ